MFNFVFIKYIYTIFVKSNHIFYFQNKIHIEFITTHAKIPQIVGKAMATAVHFKLLVSLYIVKHVVEHGQCIRENIIVHIAVFIVHPFNIRISRILISEVVSTSSPVIVYAISAIGRTISFAGKPNMNAISITPSSPITLASGSKKLVQYSIIVLSPTLTFANSHISSPVGKATITALPKTNSVLSKIDLTIMLPMLGALYGGNSNVNDEASPFKIVFDKIFEEINVIIIPIKIIPISITVPTIDEIIPELIPTKNIVIIDIIVGNLPLHGTKLLVNIAINLSLGESIIRAPITPQALHPKPIHIVNACLPHALHFLKTLSKLNAILGSTPKSSNSVNSGKNIAIGGNITDITQVKTLYPPPKEKPGNPLIYSSLFKCYI